VPPYFLAVLPDARWRWLHIRNPDSAVKTGPDRLLDGWVELGGPQIGVAVHMALLDQLTAWVLTKVSNLASPRRRAICRRWPIEERNRTRQDGLRDAV
jgi:hypothetical protein